MTNAYQQQGFDVACLNFRGCCGEANDLLGGYHLGFTQDVLHFLDVLKSRTGVDVPPLYLSGFSLGANVVLKALGELGMKAPEHYNIFGAAAFCAPFDAERNAPFLGRHGFNQVVYCENLLRTLRKRAQLQLELYCSGDESTDSFDYKGVMEAKTITDFDEAFVAPIYGFDSACDYYRKTSSIYFLDTIAVPTLILNSRDDPFMDPDHFPIELTQEGGGQAPIKMVITKNGGHLGYLFHQVESSDAILQTSWSSTELARFFQHIHRQHIETNQ
jgi:predicted alpha/beta-fold hydrolase